jgi:Ca2+-binding RTX toxin-like protein
MKKLIAAMTMFTSLMMGPAMTNTVSGQLVIDSHTVILEDGIDNVVFVTSTPTTINYLINGQYYSFDTSADRDINFRIYDGDGDLHIEFSGASGKYFICDGSKGDDYMINHSSNSATFDGGGGADEIIGGFGNNLIDGGNDDDILSARSGYNCIFGGYGDDHLTGGSGVDYLFGGPGADILDGGPGDDHLFGNHAEIIGGVYAPSKTRPLDGETDIFTGGAGSDTFHFAWYYWKKGSGIFSIKLYREKEIITDFQSWTDTKLEYLLPIHLLF